LTHLQLCIVVYDAINALQHGAVDGFNFNGGLARFRELDAIASVANLPCWHGSEIDLGILEAMYVHQSAAARSCTWPGDIFGRLIRSHDLLTEPLRIEPPFAFIPEGPGLGISLDEAVVQRFATAERSIA
jgi:muconate cycloisomerase